MAEKGIEVATAFVSLVADTSSLGRDIRRTVGDAQKEISSKPLKVTADTKSLERAKAEIDSLGRKMQAAREAEATAAEKVRVAETKLAEVREGSKAKASQLAAAEAAVSKARAAATDKVAVAEAKLTEVRESGKAKQSQILAAEAALSKARVAATEDVRVAETKLAEVRDSSNVKASQLVAAETAASKARRDQGAATREAARVAQELSEAQTRLASGTRQSTKAIGDHDQAAKRSSLSLGGVAKGLGLVAANTAKIGAVGAGIAAIGGAAGVALGAVGALGVGLAALGPAAGAAVGTAVVGLHGVGDAFKAITAAQDSAGEDSKAKAKAVEAAQKQVESAVRGVATAEKNLQQAKKSSEAAEKDLSDARKEATRTLQDYQLQLRGASLNEKDAQLSLREAQADLIKTNADVSSTALERERAALRVQEAEQRLAETQESNRELVEKANDAQAKGVEGADNVVAAKEKVADANDRVKEAEQSVAEAQSNVADAQKSLTEAMTEGSSAQNKAAEALAKLSPNARDFVLAAESIKPAWDDAVKSTQNALFAGSADGIKQLATAALPTLKAGMVDVATSMNGLTKQFAAFWQTPQALAGVQSVFAGVADVIDGMGPGLQQATQGVLSLSQAFAPVAGQIGADIGSLIGSIGQAFTDAFNNGSLTELVSNFGSILAGLGDGLKPLIDGLIQVGNIIGPVLGPFLAQLGQTLGAIMPSLGELGASLLSSLKPILPVLGNLISSLAEGLGPVLPVLARLLDAVMAALQPLIEPLSEVAQVVGSALAQAVVAITPAIGPLATAFSSLITALAPIIPVVAQVVSGIVQALAPALTTVFDALAPVIQQVADSMMPIFKQLQPVLAEVAGVIGDALSQAITALMPVIPVIAKSFGDLILAVAPLLPQLVQLAVQMLPPIVDILVQLIPILTKVTDAFTWLVSNVLMPIVMPALKALSDTMTTATDVAVNVVTAAKNSLGPALTSVGGFFSDLGTTVSSVWNGIVKAIAIGVKAVGEILQKVKIPDWVPGIGGKGANGLGDSLVQWADAHMATGGLLNGPGTGTSDSMLIAASTGEYVVNARATGKNLPLLEAINAGWVPSPAYLRNMVGDLPKFATGGLVPGKAFAQSMDPAVYEMGGFSRSSIDCSGIVSAVVNDALGNDPFSSRMSTVSEGDWLTARGAQPGLGAAGDLQIGWFDHGGGANGHTALTLSDGTNVESNGSDGVIIGGPVGAASSMFDHQMHIPAALLRGGDLGGPAGGLGSPGGGGGGGGRPGGGSLGASTPGAGSGTSGTDVVGAGGATPVLVTNWPAALGGTPATTPGAVPGVASPAAPGLVPPAGSPIAPLAPGTPVPWGPTPATPSGTPAPTYTVGDGSTHPLASLPGAGKLFSGPAPWYMAPTPEAALTNLGTQAASLATNQAQGLAQYFQNNWKEMLQTGLAGVGMAAGAGGGGGDTYQFNGYNERGVGQVIERNQRRRALAMQRSGGFGR
ncbi:MULTISPECIES: hypothetical protein [Actinomycetes]|uniref:hypothetical protein n=1 Tax=Micromonospora sp. NPDC005367 TaxID=3155590 RepID=UPI0033B3C9AB